MKDKQLFTVYQIENGFYARMTDGSMVIGNTLSELCLAATAKATDIVVQKGDDDDDEGDVFKDIAEEDDDEEVPVKKPTQWKKVT